MIFSKARLMPYIESISERIDRKNDVSYNEDNGVYTIHTGREDFRILHRIIGGEEEGTLFLAHPHEFYLMDYLETM